MQIELTNAGKQYNRIWLFRRLTLTIGAGDRWALLGANGSGKSTLLRILTAKAALTEGTAAFKLNGKMVETEQVYQHLSWAAPAVELYPYLTLEETYALHFKFKRCLLSGIDECFELFDLQTHRQKQLRQLSSGLLQRAKVALALFTQSDLLLLDEPTSFMDERNAERTLRLIETYCGARTYILASNSLREYEKLDNRIELGVKSS